MSSFPVGLTVRKLFAACTAFVLAVSAGAGVRAADLRITYGELTELVRTIAGDAKIYLNNVPPGPLMGLFSTGSSVTVSGATYPIPIPVKTFGIFNSTYAYYINDVTSTSLRIVPGNAGLQLIMEFEDQGAELVARCVTGACSLSEALPNIEWPGAGARIDLEPIQFNGSVSLRIKRVRLMGSPRAVCQSEAGFISSSACSIGRPWANRTIAQVRPEIERSIRDAVNQPELQQQLADGLKKFLTLGPAGVIKIDNLALDPKSMTVKFNFAASGG
ncbi:MAG: hypothetical protein RLZ98_2817 [Pseudomonadota bacterium]|jgi:hypothetical protein